MILIFLCIQVIQPARNSSEKLLSTDIGKVVILPPNVYGILKASCYDCHSNKTEYPWYSWIQPVAGYMNYHIIKGKANLNFSEFGTYSKRKQAHKFRSIIEQVNKEAMPIASYTAIHTNAKLTASQKELIITWADSCIIKNNQ